MAGQAGVGKDEVGKHLYKNYHAATVAQADPLKRFVSSVFEFSERQLWGPSEARNLSDPRFIGTAAKIEIVISDVNRNFADSSSRWLDEILVDEPASVRPTAEAALTQWFVGLTDRVGLGQGLSARICLQSIGTEFGRSINKDIWSKYAIRVAKRLLDDGRRYDRNWGLKYSRTEGLSFDSGVSAPAYVVITDSRFLNEIENIQAIDGVVLLIQRPSSQGSLQAEAAGIKGHQSERELNSIPTNLFDGVIVNDGSIEDLYGNVDNFMASFYPKEPAV